MYEFNVPVKIVSGEGAVFNLPNELERLSTKNPLIVTDKGIVDAGLIKKVEVAFEDVDMKMPIIFDEIPQETSLDSIINAYEKASNAGVDGIVAIGGGSVIDSAKLLSIMLTQRSDKVERLMGVEIMPKRMIPFIVIPTTTGTGSEVTSVAVIFDKKKGQKMAFASQYLMPDVAILDTNMVVSLPKRLLASSSLDALSHAIEAYISIQTNPISRALSYKAVAAIWRNLPLALKYENSNIYREELLNASTMAGMAFSNAMVGIVHSLAHATGSILHIPHGEAVSLFLVAGLKANLDASCEALAELFDAVPWVDKYIYDSVTKKASGFVYMLENFVNDVRKKANLPVSLREVGYKESHKKEIIKLALLDGSSIFSPIDLTEELASAIIDEVSA